MEKTAKKERILLTGASGTVGFEVLKLLIRSRKNMELTVFDLKTRNSVKKLSKFKTQVNLIYGNINNLDDVRKICTNQDVVIHLAAVIPPLADEEPELCYQVNFTGIQNLLYCLEKQSPEAFLFYSSSISVYGDRLKNPFIRVGDPLFPCEGDVYAQSKIKAEQAIQQSKLQWCIFRLAAVMGGHKISKLMFHPPLNTQLEIITPEDTAAAFVNSLEFINQLPHKIFNLGGGLSCRASYNDFLARSFKIYGLGKLNFPLKSFAEKNFHCGYYDDGNLLNELVHFRNKTLRDYFENQKFGFFKKSLITLFRVPIKKYLLKKSEPYRAWISKDSEKIRFFFSEKHLV